MAESTMLEESQTEVGANKGVPGMVKPSDIIAAEQRRLAGGGQPSAPGAPPVPAAPGAPPPPPATPPGPGDLTVNHDELLQKVEKGEALSDDEKAILAIMKKEVETGSEPPAPGAAPGTPEPKYKIGQQEFTKSELLTKIRTEETELGDLKITPATEEKILQWYVKSQNRTEQQRSTQAESERLAHERKIQSEKEIQLNTERARLEGEISAITRERKSLADEKKVLTATLATPVKAEEIEDAQTGKINHEKNAQFLEQRAATKRLQAIAAKEQELTSSEAELSYNRFKTTVHTFVAANPQYGTKEEVFTVWDKVSRGEAVDPEDELKVQELDRIFVESLNRKIPAEKVFAYYQKANQLAIKPPAQSGNGRPGALPPEPKPAKTAAEIIRAHKQRAALAPPGAPGGGNQQRGGGVERAAEHIVKADAKALGREDDQFLSTELGYSH